MSKLFATRPARLFWAFIVPFLIGSLLLTFGGDLGQMFGRNELTPWASDLGRFMLGAAAIQLLRVVLFPYVDLASLFFVGSKTSDGASRLALGICIVIAAMVLAFGGTARAETLPLPPNAVKYLPVLKAEQQTYWSAMPIPVVLAGQVEQETCVSLKSIRCWSPQAELKTRLEQGIGFGQITRTSRFDALAELRAEHPKELAGWAWDSELLYDPHMQMRALVLKNEGLWRRIVGAATPDDHAAFMLASYNGGLGGTVRRRLLCRGTKGCDEGRWWGHVEQHDWRSRVVPPGYGKSPSDINTEYPRLVMRVRSPRYVGWL